MNVRIYQLMTKVQRQDESLLLRFAMAFRKYGILVLLALFLSVSIGSARAEANDAIETTYVWQRGDTLSSALFKLGLGRSKSGPRLYGSKGWVAKNSDRYKGKDWDAIEPGTPVLLLIPSGLNAAVEPKVASLPEVRSVPTSQAVVQASPKPIANQTPDPIVESIPEPIAEPIPEPVKEPANAATEEPKPESVALETAPEPLAPKPVIAKRAQAKTKAKAKAKDSQTLSVKQDVGLLVVLLSFSAFTVWSLRARSKIVRDKKISLVANSFLSWLTYDASHTNEHISMAETLFAGDVSDRSLKSYEVMGFLNVDFEQLKALEDRMRIDSFAPPFAGEIAATQSDYLYKFMTLSPEVFCAIIGSATSPFLQIRALRLASYYMNNNGSLIALDDLVPRMTKHCSKYPRLYKNQAVCLQVRKTLETLESVKRIRSAS